jgi:polysaccharide export outer membrane protein
MKMSLKIVFALVSAGALCCGQTDATSSSGIPAKEVHLPTIPLPASPPETSQNASGPGPGSQNGPAPQAAPASQPAAPAGDQPKAPGKPAAAGRQAGAKPVTGHKAYVFGPLDVISVKVWENANLSGLQAVDSDGMLSLPLIGEIKADGLTARELRDVITQRLKECCVNEPEGRVDVAIAKVNSKRYFVYGGVGRPGEYPLVQETTVMDALSSVGGFKDFANKKKIRIQRMLPSGATQEFKFNYNDVSKGRHMEENILIENGDRIFVAE